jgi:hypothetical protein
LEHGLELAGVDPVVALVMSQEGLEGLLQHAPTALAHRRSPPPCRYLHLQPSLIFGQLLAHDVLHWRRSFVALLFLRRLTSTTTTLIFISNLFSPLLPLLVARYCKFGRWHVEMAATQISPVACWRWRCVGHLNAFDSKAASSPVQLIERE